jgi:hypothetical protein
MGKIEVSTVGAALHYNQVVNADETVKNGHTIFMSIRVFVGSTCDDLKDCRSAAVKVIARKAPLAVAEAMENWNEEHVDPTQVCCKKVSISTHYLGIFAYRHGWVPGYPELQGKSITEAEYDWAEEFGKPRYILMPDPTEKYAIDLFLAALTQSEREEKAQKAFIDRVKKNNCNFFKNIYDLADKIDNMVNRWIEKD